MLAAFIIFLREGVEAGIVIAAMLAYLDQTGQRHRRGVVFGGAGAALALACGAGVVAYVVMQRYDGTDTQLVIELVSFLVAAVLLTVMLFWMRMKGPASRRALLHSTEHALGRGGGVALGTVAFVSVGREGLEAAVFALAIVFAGGRGSQAGAGWAGVLGAAAGVAVAVVLSCMIFVFGRRVNLGTFFTVLGVALLVLGAGLMVDAMTNMTALGWIGGEPVWNSSSVLGQSGALGDAAHSLVGYVASPTWPELVTWVAYMAICLPLYLYTGRGDRRGRVTKSSNRGRSTPASSEQVSLVSTEQGLDEVESNHGG